MIKHKIVLILILIIFFGLNVISAQQGRGRGRIHGTVYDDLGNPLEKAKITAEHAEFGTKFTSESDEKGNWAIAGLGTGVFIITAAKDGYAPAQTRMNVSQFSSNNPSVEMTLTKIGGEAAGVPDMENQEALALFEEGNQLFEQGQYQEAVAAYQEFLEKQPSIYQININIGNAFKEMQEYEKAISAFETVLDKVREEKGSLEGNEAAARALAGIGESYISMDQLDKAGEYLSQAVDIFPKDETLAFNVGEIYFKQGKPAEAVQYYDTASNIKSDWPPPYRQKGYALLNLGDYAAAIESFEKFLEVAPDDPGAPVIENLIPQLRELIK
ncbi:MAG: tetratricopeptide repeat protein [Candidatus Aminicenantes bacterium]